MTRLVLKRAGDILGPLPLAAGLVLCFPLLWSAFFYAWPTRGQLLLAIGALLTVSGACSGLLRAGPRARAITLVSVAGGTAIAMTISWFAPRVGLILGTTGLTLAGLQTARWRSRARDRPHSPPRSPATGGLVAMALAAWVCGLVWVGVTVLLASRGYDPWSADPWLLAAVVSTGTLLPWQRRVVFLCSMGTGLIAATFAWTVLWEKSALPAAWSEELESDTVQTSWSASGSTSQVTRSLDEPLLVSNGRVFAHTPAALRAKRLAVELPDAIAGGRARVGLWPWAADPDYRASLTRRRLEQWRQELLPDGAAALLLDAGAVPLPWHKQLVARFSEVFQQSALFELGPGQAFLLVGLAGNERPGYETVDHRLEQARTGHGPDGEDDLAALLGQAVAGGPALRRAVRHQRQPGSWPPLIPPFAELSTRRAATDLYLTRDPASALDALFDGPVQRRAALLGAARQAQDARPEELAATRACLSGLLDQAIARMRLALVIDPTRGHARAALGGWLLQRGVSALRSGNLSRAADDLSESLTLLTDPRPRARAQLALARIGAAR